MEDEGSATRFDAAKSTWPVRKVIIGAVMARGDCPKGVDESIQDKLSLIIVHDIGGNK